MKESLVGLALLVGVGLLSAYVAASYVENQHYERRHGEDKPCSCSGEGKCKCKTEGCGCPARKRLGDLGEVKDGHK